MANPFMYAVFFRLEANSGLISNPEVLHILQQRSSQRASLGESLPVEQKVSPGLFYFRDTVVSVLLMALCCIRVVGKPFLAVQASKYLLDKYPKSPSRDQLQAFSKAVKVSLELRP